jgi:hypothetical protein
MLGTVLMVLAFLYLVGCKQSIPPYTVNDPKDANTCWRTEKPLNYEEAVANGHCPIPLPKEARNIQFVDFYAGWGGFSQHVRFEAPMEVCREQARAILNDFNSRQTQDSQRVEVTAKPLDWDHASSVARDANSWEVVSRAPWFDSDSIQKGEMWGAGRSHQPEVFIDLERGVFYYRRSD